MLINQLSELLTNMKQCLIGLGFDTVSCEIHVETDNKMYAMIRASDHWQKGFDHSDRVMQLNWTEFYSKNDDKDVEKIISEMWAEIYSAKPLDERELHYTMKKLSGLAELDLSSEFGKMLAERCKAVYEDAKSLQLTFQASPTIQPAPDSSNWVEPEADDMSF